ncbi:TetR/AcrR family transcriptional regulator [Arthrobacter sp. KNU40]|uniref:TetR/AcrR family transcriptional regulator n=1 Tax=Arthrobacter sp. KNU40 TaxID=3447965 RepID=UPI003F6304F3
MSKVKGRDAKSAPIGLREKSRRETLGRIRAAAVELLAERGYDQMTTREVAERAEVGEATLFRYVNSKQQLLLLVVGDKMDEHIDTIIGEDTRTAKGGPADAGSFLQRIHGLYKARADFYLGDPENVTSYVQNAFVAGSDLGAKNIAQGDRVIERVALIIREGQALGHLLASVDAQVVAQNCQGIYVHEILRRSVRGFSHESLEERVRARLDAQLLPLVRP